MNRRLSGSSLAALRRWRTVVAAHSRYSGGLAALTFRMLVPPTDGLVRLEEASAAILRVQPNDCGLFPLQFSIYGASAVPWGMRWGSIADCRLTKNLRLRPRLRARGRRLDLKRQRMLHLGMDLFEAVQQADERRISDDLKLPTVWAGFDPDLPVAGDGPELVGEMHRRGRNSTDVMNRHYRKHQGLVLYPLPYVSHLWEHATLFVEPSSVPTIQVIHCDDPTQALVGFRGACEFDFCSSPFDVPMLPA